MTYVVRWIGAEVRPTGTTEAIRASVVNGVEVLMLPALSFPATVIDNFDIFCCSFSSRYGFGINSGSSGDQIQK